MPARAMWPDGDEAVLEVEYDAGLVDRIRPFRADGGTPMIGAGSSH